MANEVHVAVVKSGQEAVRKWRADTPNTRLDLRSAELPGADLRGVEFINSDLAGANFQGANLAGANFHNGDLTGANFRGADLTNAQLTGATLRGADLTNARLDGAVLEHASLVAANLTNASLRAARLPQADFSSANIAGTRFWEAFIDEVEFAQIVGLVEAKALETVRVSPGNDARHLDSCFRPWTERLCDWESLRRFGNLPLFGVSYSALAFLTLYIYAVAWYNEKVELAHAWAVDVSAAEGKADVPPKGLKGKAATRLEEGRESAASSLARAIKSRLPLAAVGWRTWLALASTLLLVLASTLYRVFCPSRVQEFSKEAWCYELNKSLLHYWPLSWQRRPMRIVCMVGYILGGSSASFLLAVKIVDAVRLICQNS